MKKFTMFACLALALVFALSSFAGELPRVTRGHNILHGGSVSFEKAYGDTLNLMAAAEDPTNNVNPINGCEMPGFDPVEPYYLGDFENGDDMGMVGTDGSGWTSLDITQPIISNWQVSDYDGNNTPYSSMRAYCGDTTIAACGPDDPVGGYGNSWNDLLVFSKAVGNTAVSSTVAIEALLQHDTEPGYDYVYLSAQYLDQEFDDLGVWDGMSNPSAPEPPNFAQPFTVTANCTYLPADYLEGNIELYFRFTSDGGWSDEDCSFAGGGACQVDDITVTITNDGVPTVYTENFDGTDPLDPANGSWTLAYPVGVGDYARIWRGLEDADPCNTNYTAQVAMVDDPAIGSGSLGYQCLNWCYGPGGYIVNPEGGLAGPTAHLHNAIESPVMNWPVYARNDCGGDVPDGITLAFDIYRHEDLSDDAPGIFYTWDVRSAAPGDDIEAAGWLNRNFVYYGGPDYVRAGDEVTDLMVESRDRVQVQVAAYEIGYIWGYIGVDGYPAPYFDNITVKIYPFFGPAFATRAIDVANDGFPAIGSLEPTDLAAHSIRFDMANNISLASHLRNDPGDSIICDVVPIRAGATLTVDSPRMYYHLKRNPLFDVGRTSGLPDIGSVFGLPAVGTNGQVVPDRYAFDLPDTGFLFPGDVLHYYIGATDEVGGVQQSGTFPADTTGFSTNFAAMGYDSRYRVRGLPTLMDDGEGGFDQPGMLFINDFGARGGENEWFFAMNNLGLLIDEDYDVYHVNGPSSGVSNGIGGRTNDFVLEGYTDILYTAGNLGKYTIANADFDNDAGDDIGVLTAWMDQGGKDLFLTGDDLGSDLLISGLATSTFLEEYMGLAVDNNDVRGFIGNQATPLVEPIDGNPVFVNEFLTDWVAYGGCNSINTFDAVRPVAGATRIAEFVDPLGAGYEFSAATLKTGVGLAGTSRTVSMPYDFKYITTNPNGAPNILPARVRVLRDVLAYFGIEGNIGDVTGVEDTPSRHLAVGNFPNPFNPSTTIKFNMPKGGHLALSVYNVRGQLVKTLIDGNRAEGPGEIVWDGTDNLGSAVSSGVYFYEARTDNEVKVNKMALVK